MVLIACTAATSLLVVGALFLTIKSIGENSSAGEQVSGEPDPWKDLKEKSLSTWRDLREGVGIMSSDLAKTISVPTSTETSTADAQSTFLKQLEEAVQQEKIKQ